MTSRIFIFLGLILSIRTYGLHTISLPIAQVATTNITELDLLTSLHVDTNDLPDQLIWDSITVTFQLDTRFIDMRFKHRFNNGNLLVSQITQQTGLSNYLYTDFNLAGLPAGSIKPLGNFLYEVTLLIAQGTENHSFSHSNLWLTGTNPRIPIKLLINGAAIQQNGGSYQINPVLNENYLIFPTHPLTSRRPLEVLGGQFTTVPEPSGIVTLISLLGGGLSKRRFHARK